jgi:hypothetical protein
MKMKFFSMFRNRGEIIAGWGEARLIKYLDGKVELRGGSKEDRLAAQEWISLFWHEAVVQRETDRAKDFRRSGYAAARGHSTAPFQSGHDRGIVE